MTLVNRWLHREVGMALNVESATFNAETFCWRLPIHLAYGGGGSLGVWQAVEVYLIPGNELKAQYAFADLWEEAYGHT